MITSNKKTGFYNAMLKLIHANIVIMKTNAIVFFICVGLCTIVFAIYSYANSNYYKASFTIAYDEFFRKLYGDKLEKINLLLNQQEYSKLANSLHANIEVVKSLKRIEGENILGGKLKDDLNTDNIPFVVTIVVKDTSVIYQLQSAIVNFLEVGNDYLKQRKMVRLDEIDEELSYLNKQIVAVDSVISQSIKSVFRRTEDDTEISVVSLIERKYQLYKQKQELVRKERMPSSLFVIDDAIVSEKAGMPLLLAIAIGTLCGFILFLIVVLLFIPALRYKSS